MKFYFFFALVFSALTLICLVYAVMAFVDTDTWTFTWEFDPFRLFAGLGVSILCFRTVLKYINLILDSHEDL